MSYRYFWLVVCGWLSVSSAQAAPPAKNVLIVINDDWGRQAGCYGDKIARTPNFDALATQGTRFSRAFCTTASCSPSRSAIMSGLFPHASGQYGLAHADHNFHCRPFVRGLPVLLKEAGYRTLLAGKHHVIPEEQFAYEKTANGKINLRSTVQLAERVEEFLKEPDERPFFVYYCPIDPHRAAKGWGNEGTYPGVVEQIFKPSDIVVPPFLPDNPVVREDLAGYYQAISRADAGLGRVLQALENTGHADDTLVLVLADNGPPFPGAKTTVYDAGVHLPLVVRKPGQEQRGQVSDAMVSWVDIVPTVLEWTGAEGPKYKLHGRSFLGEVGGTTDVPRDHVFLSHTFHEVTMYYPMRGIRTRKHKCILNLAHHLPFPSAQDLWASPTWQTTLERKLEQYGPRPTAAYLQRPAVELYDLEADPHEAKNLAEDPASQPIVSELKSRIRAWQEATDDPWLVKYLHE
jgi:N-sulfoglucosamine sulfohydrolase